MATIKDVAKLAGLSVSTVSRFLNNHPYISEDKRQRIKQAMTELNYAPSSVATQLRSKKGTMIGILVSRITNPFFSYLVDAIEKEAKKFDYNVLVMQTYDDADAEIRMLELLKQQVVAGIIMCSVEGEASVIESYCSFGPIVLCNERIPSSSIPQVFTDQKLASYEATCYLIQQGYQKIAYCTGGSLTKGGHGNERTQGFETAISQHHYPMKTDWVFKQVHTIADGHLVGEKLLSLPEKNRPDAIFTSSDEVASGILAAYLKAGKKIPEDLAIIGFDNQPFTELLAVPLTTIAQPVEKLGQEATKYMVAQLHQEKYQIETKALKLSLIKRESA